MRNAFALTITDLARTDERIVLLSGDIGNRLFDKFKTAFPNRFFNCGVAEANMASMAAGMAAEGLKPFVYTIAPFTTARCFEQIRVDICYHNVPVTIVGVGAGLSYASLGPTHHSCEDIAILRTLPHMSVVCPADPVEVRLAIHAAAKHSGPLYIRLGKKGEPIVHRVDPVFVIGRGIVVRDGHAVGLLSTGALLPVAMAAAEQLEKNGVSTNVVSFHTVKPLDEALLEDYFKRFKLVASVEEHGRIGGLGSAIAEWLALSATGKARLLSLGTPDEFLHESGSQAYARGYFGLTPEAIAAKILARLSASP